MSGYEQEFPNYLQFKPSPTAIELHTNLTQQLQLFERKINTSSNIPVKSLAADHLMPIVLLMQQWSLAAQSDLLNHTHDIAQYLSDNAGNEAVDPDLLVVAIDFVNEFKRAIDVEMQTDAMGFQKAHPALIALAEKAPPLLAALQDTLENLEGDEDEDEDESIFEEDEEPAESAPADEEGEGGGTDE